LAESPLWKRIDILVEVDAYESKWALSGQKFDDYQGSKPNHRCSTIELLGKPIEAKSGHD
jgi:hypothetical protein